MPRLGLALSGGGFRATLYHLGIVRFLRDSGQLSQVTDIASVSGGSILAGHLVLNWDRYCGTAEQFDEAAQEIIDFVQFDVRNHIIRRIPLQYPWRYLSKFTPINSELFAPNSVLEHYYAKMLYGNRRLYELPEEPNLHMLTTNISTGALAVFGKQGLFIQHRNNLGQPTFELIPGTMARMAQVVGASSAFPGLFPPVKITATDIGVREGQFSTEWFTDGGVYDNLGIRAFSWLQSQDTQFDQILVSDAGKPFQILSDASLGVIGQSIRATDILWDRVWQLERENFGNREGFSFLPVSERIDPNEDPTALHPVVQTEVQSIRTDLDAFSDIEINALAQHGYSVARKYCRHLSDCDESTLKNPPWAPLPDASLSLASIPETSTSRGIAETTRQSLELRDSSQRRTVSTLLSWRDWPSYLYVLLAFILFFYIPLQVFELYRHSKVQGYVINAIKEGDPEISKILTIIDSDPTEDWQSEVIESKREAALLDNYKDVEVLTHSRIIDLRRWNPTGITPDERGRVYVQDRRVIKLLRSFEGDRRITIRSELPLKNVEVCQRNSTIKGVVSRVIEPVDIFGENRTAYEIEYDLSRVPLEEPVEIEVEFVADFPDLMENSAPIVIRMQTDLLNVWMLFPEDRPYTNFSLVRYPIDRVSPPEVMDVRYTVNHPYGLLIGWSVVTPKIGTVYECRWTE